MRAQIWQSTSQEGRGGFWGFLGGVAKGRWRRPEGRVANGSYACGYGKSVQGRSKKLLFQRHKSAR
jgi:hypothetical protein